MKEYCGCHNGTYYVYAAPPKRHHVSSIPKLDHPIKVLGTPNDGFNSKTRSNITKIQLLAGINLSIYKNRKVRCTGAFFRGLYSTPSYRCLNDC